MNSFIEKVERISAKILDMMEVETGLTEAVVPHVDDDLGRDDQFHNDSQLIELCW